MDKALDKHLETLEKYARITLLLTFILIFSFLFFGVLLYYKSKYCLIFAILFLFSAIVLYMMTQKAKMDEKENVYEPVSIKFPQKITYEDFSMHLKKLANNKYLSMGENLLFYKINQIFKLHIVVYKTESFVKKEFDSAKKRINRKANVQFNISQEVSRFDSGQLMRYNIVFTENMNDALNKLISRNANHNLNREEGVVNMVVSPREIIIPPLFGRCDVGQVSRYKRTVEFVYKYFVDSLAEQN